MDLGLGQQQKKVELFVSGVQNEQIVICEPFGGGGGWKGNWQQLLVHKSGPQTTKKMEAEIKD